MTDVFTDSHVMEVNDRIVAITVTYNTSTGEILETDSRAV